MGKEIERKFLIKSDEYLKEAVESHTLCQGYLSTNPQATVRVRIYDDKGYLTVKGLTKGIQRHEYEYEVPIEDAREMLGMCGSSLIEKTRYILIYDGRKWELDVFHGKLEGLKVAEIELESAEESIALPPFIGKEVSHDPRYFNSNLTKLSSSEIPDLMNE